MPGTQAGEALTEKDKGGRAANNRNDLSALGNESFYLCVCAWVCV